MPIHIDTHSGFLLYSSSLCGQGRQEGQVYFPPLETSLNEGVGHGHILIRSKRGSHFAKRIQLHSHLYLFPFLNRVKKNSLKWRIVFIFFGIFYWIFISNSWQENQNPLFNRLTPSFAGYDFSLPFRFEVFFKKKVSESIPFSSAKVLHLPELPLFGFLKMPSHVADGEQAFLLTRGSWADALVFSSGPLVRKRLSKLGSCGDLNVYTAWAGASLLIPAEKGNSSAVLVSPPDLDIVCSRARVVADHAT